MTSYPTTKLYTIAKSGASQKWDAANALIDLALTGSAISHIEIAEVQKCAQILDDFAHEIYNDPAMWEPVDSLETMQARQELLEKTLAEEPVTQERAAAIMAELAEIEAWFQKEMIFIDNVGTQKLCARFSDPL